MYLRKMRPRTTCLYSAASMLLRSLSAASQSLASKPRWAEESLGEADLRLAGIRLCALWRENGGGIINAEGWDTNNGEARGLAPGLCAARVPGLFDSNSHAIIFLSGLCQQGFSPFQQPVIPAAASGFSKAGGFRIVVKKLSARGGRARGESLSAEGTTGHRGADPGIYRQDSQSFQRGAEWFLRPGPARAQPSPLSPYAKASFYALRASQDTTEDKPSYAESRARGPTNNCKSTSHS